ncbi:MAG: TRAP transporter large permease subunit [Halothiobacillaceae bacterium]|nr:TRAP transporter large permease subunit [Halothiobacillaceae bacterium]
MEIMAILLVLAVFGALLFGYPVAFTLAGVSLIFAALGSVLGVFDASLLDALPNRLFGIMVNETLIAVPLFILMGVILERSRIAEDLLDSLSALFGRVRGGLGYSVVLVGAVLAASTGIVGATVVTLGLIALPLMLRRGYDPALSCGTLCASGTLGQIIPPSIILVLLGDQLSSAYAQAQLKQGIFAPEPVSVGDLFMGALIPGVLLVLLYLLYLALTAWRRPHALPAHVQEDGRLPPPSLARLLATLTPALSLILLVLGSIMLGIATPTEAAAVGSVGALLIAALKGRLTLDMLRDAARATVRMTSMVFMIFIGASLFSLVFRGFGGDEMVHEALHALPGGAFTAVLLVMLVMFLLGFILDFIEIIFVVVPIVAPVLLMMGVDPVWLGVMIAINLQTSFLTPPFGFSLFYLRGVAPAGIATTDIYRGVAPFVGLQLGLLALVAAVPALATWLPKALYG